MYFFPNKAALSGELTVNDLMYGLLQLVWSAEKIERESLKEIEKETRDGDIRGAGQRPDEEKKTSSEEERNKTRMKEEQWK